MSSDSKMLKAGSLRRILRVLGPHLRPHRPKLILAALAMIVATAMEIAAPWPIKILFDGLLIPQAIPRSGHGFHAEA